jgi:hypothetical protein
MEIGTVAVRGEEISRYLRQKVDLVRGFPVPMEGMVGSAECGVYWSLWLRAEKRMKWRI